MAQESGRPNKRGRRELQDQEEQAPLQPEFQIGHPVPQAVAGAQMGQPIALGYEHDPVHEVAFIEPQPDAGETPISTPRTEPIAPECPGAPLRDARYANPHGNTNRLAQRLFPQQADAANDDESNTTSIASYQAYSGLGGQLPTYRDHWDDHDHPGSGGGSSIGAC